MLGDIYMGKLIIISKDKKNYNMEIYLNEQKICDLRPTNEKYFQLNNKNYSIYCFSKHSQNKSSVETIDLSKNVIVEVNHGFTHPKIKVMHLNDEDIKQYDNSLYINLEINDNKENVSFAQSSNTIGTNINKKKENILSILVRFIIGIFLFCLGANLIFGNNNDYSSNFSHTVDYQGIDEYGIYKISGTVINNTNNDIDGVQIEFKCYDLNHNHLDTISTYTENLASGETWSYEIKEIGNADKISSCDFYQITPFVKIAEFH